MLEFNIDVPWVVSISKTSRGEYGPVLLLVGFMAANELNELESFWNSLRFVLFLLFTFWYLEPAIGNVLIVDLEPHFYVRWSVSFWS